MAGRGRHLADEALAAALASGATVEDAAAKAGVSTATAHRRLKEPAFAARVTAIRGEMVARTVGQLSSVANNAVLALVKLLDSKDERVVLGTARAILDKTFQGSEATTFAAQVEALKAELEQVKNGIGDPDKGSEPDAGGPAGATGEGAATAGAGNGPGPPTLAADEPP